MRVYRESNLEVVLPVNEEFRFGDCPAYRTLSGANLKEMDFGWWDAENKTLWLMEVKDYSQLALEERLPIDLFDTFVNKATDSLMMLASAWFGSAQGIGISGCLPASCRIFPSHPYKIKLVFLLKVNSHTIPEIETLRDRLKNRLKGRVALFDMAVTNVILLDHNTAMNVGLPIRAISP
jgi:hypothetical protein